MLLNVSHLHLLHDGELIVEVDPAHSTVTTLFRGLSMFPNRWDFADLDADIQQRIWWVVEEAAQRTRLPQHM